MDFSLRRLPNVFREPSLLGTEQCFFERGYDHMEKDQDPVSEKLLHSVQCID